MTAIAQASVSQVLGSAAAALTQEQIPEQVRAHVELLVLDSLWCAALGATREEVRLLERALRTTEREGPSMVWSSLSGLSAPSAAMVNATATHAFELDDVAIGQHYGSSTIPAALAVAHLADDRSGGRLIEAIVAGCEIAARIQAAVGRVPHAEVGFHGPSVIASFASAVTASKMLGLDAEQIGHAIGHAAQQASGIMATQHGGMGKRLLAGTPARNGVLAALLAREGFTSGAEMLEKEYGGFFSTFSGGRATWDAERALRTPGEWATLDARFKLWACRFPIHPALEGLRSLREAHGIAAEDVAWVEVTLDAAAKKAVGFPWTPSSTASAQMNLQVCVASYLLDDSVFLPQFTPDAVNRPEMLALAARVRVADAPPEDGLFKRSAPVAVGLHSGELHRTVGHVRGGWDDPDTPHHVETKTRRIARVLGIHDSVPALWAGALVDLPDVGRLGAACANAQRAAVSARAGAASS